MSHSRQSLEFGEADVLTLEVPPEKLVAHVGIPKGPYVEEPALAVRQQLNTPDNFPPLVEATVPGDRIALTVNHGVPQAAAIVSGIVNTLLESGRTEPEQIRVVLASGWENPQQITAALPDPLCRRIRVSVHEPENGQNLAYLAANREGSAILLNRHLCDADLVIPIGCVRPAGGMTDAGIIHGVFPAFADGKTYRRFLLPKSWETKKAREERRREIEEAAWLLGACFTVQVVPASGDRILQVLAGDAGVVEKRGAELAHEHWQCDVPRRSGLVVAALSGGREQQTWDNLARVLFAALRVVETDGSIVVCSQLDLPVGRALSRVIGGEADPDSFDNEFDNEFDNANSDANGDEFDNQFDGDAADDAVPARLLLNARNHARIYLLSRLENNLVEDLGATPISDPHEIANLHLRHRDCILLANSQFTLPSVAQESIVS